MTETQLIGEMSGGRPFAKIANSPQRFSREKVSYGKPNPHVAIEIAEIAANFANKYPTSATAAAIFYRRHRQKPDATLLQNPD